MDTPPARTNGNTVDRAITLLQQLGVPIAILAVVIWFGGPVIGDLVRATASTAKEVPQLRVQLEKLTATVEELTRTVREQASERYAHRRMSEAWVEGHPPTPRPTTPPTTVAPLPDADGS